MHATTIAAMEEIAYPGRVKRHGTGELVADEALLIDLRQHGRSVETRVEFVSCVDQVFITELRRLDRSRFDVDLARRDRGWAPAPVDFEFEDGGVLTGLELGRGGFRSAREFAVVAAHGAA